MLELAMNKLMLCALTGALLATLNTGCAYRADLAQGNFVEQDAVNTLSYGMTPDQVRYIMGTPMLVDPFDSSRWYYVHFLREGWSSPNIKNLVLLFQGGVLVDIQGDFPKPASFGAGAPAVGSDASQATEGGYLPN